MKEINFNINNSILVKLTTIGLLELESKHNEFNKTEFIHPATDNDGYSKWQLHSLMYKFGDLLYNGLDVPFDPNIKLLIDD